jgi:hypothetical protein
MGYEDAKQKDVQSYAQQTCRRATGQIKHILHFFQHCITSWIAIAIGVGNRGPSGSARSGRTAPLPCLASTVGNLTNTSIEKTTA